ncbi:MAG: hypothetical protein EHM13_05235, partial [Acidobacteria bacterium]
MSTIAYALITGGGQREGDPGTGTRAGVNTYVVTMAALVPAEVLALHALFLSVTTNTTPAAAATLAATRIADPSTLSKAFYGLIVLCVVLYVAPRLITHKWVRLDFARSVIPPLAFVTWTMLQKATAFDAVCDLAEAPRTVSALFVAVLWGLGAAWLGYQVEQPQPV